MRIAKSISEPADFYALLKELRERSGRSTAEVEHAVGLTQAHIGKIENGEKTWGKKVLNFSQTLPWLLEYFGVTLMVVDRETAHVLTGPEFQARLSSHREKSTGVQHPKAMSLMMRVTRRPG